MTKPIMTGVDYIVNSKKPYPGWLRNHTVFKEMNKIDKVFPRIGLPNFKEPCDIMNSAEATAEAQRLGNRLINTLNIAKNELYVKIESALNSTAKERNDVCGKIQNTINIIGSVIYSLNYGDYIKSGDGKIVLKLRSDIFNGDKNPIFRKDEGLLRVIGKIYEMCEEVNYKPTKVEQFQEFKDFSRVNVPNKKYDIVFSSYGEEGCWDIATMSMRGIISCQGWNAPQSRGLIGTISSKFVGVIYVASDQEIPGYGSKMLNRSVVRFAVNKITKKPALIIDRMYPNENKETVAAFKKVLSEKSGLPTLYTYGNEIEIKNYYIPNETSRALLKQGETSYMDYQIPVQDHTVSLFKVPENMKSLTLTFKKNVYADLDKMINMKRELYVAEENKLKPFREEYDAAKKKFEEDNALLPEDQRKPFETEAPKMDEELAKFGRGGIINLLSHCDKKYGKNIAGKTFAELILNSVIVPETFVCASKEEYHRKYLMTFLKDMNKIKADAKIKYAVGTWMKSFPKSSEKFFEMIFSQMRGYMLASAKEIIKKSN
jgi:hypothetical protein